MDPVRDQPAVGDARGPTAVTIRPRRRRRAAVAPAGDVDLDAVAADLAAVEQAMERIESGTYWTDEVTGRPLGDDLLARHPTARRADDEADRNTAGTAGGDGPPGAPVAPPTP